MEIRQVRAKRTYNTCAAVTARAAVRERTCVHFLLPFCIISLPSTSSLLVLTTARSLLSRTTTTTGWAHPAGNLERTAALLSLLSARRVLDRHNGDGSPRAFDLLFVLFFFLRFFSSSSSSSSSYPSGLDDDLAAVNETLPDGWSAHHSDEGVFYHNESSGKVRRHLSLLQLLFSLFSNLLQQHFFWTSLLTTL